MHIVVAPDSFKGSLSAQALCLSIQDGIQRVLPHAIVQQFPMADGGEGTMECLVHATKGRIVQCSATDPLGRPIAASYGVLGDGETAVIEIAEASGLTLLAPHERNPLLASSRGTGELIRSALNAGYRKFLICLGGSATNDAGTGILSALGYRLLDADGMPLPDGGSFLQKLHLIDTSLADRRLQNATFTVACDVTNPLCGPNGASALFGPQKGADPDMVRQLDDALRHYGEIAERLTGRQLLTQSGGGAAGGAATAFTAFLNGQIRSGIDLVVSASGMETALRQADLLITGEGRIDRQTLNGKAIYGICQIAKRYDVPVIALCGSRALSAAEMDELGLLAALPILPFPCTLEEAIENASEWTAAQVEQLVRLLRLKN